MSKASSGKGASPGIWIRWSWRDLRARWLQVVAIALVIALGTGSYAGLSSVTKWRRASTDEAYTRLNMYDLRVRQPEGFSVPTGELESRARSALGTDAIQAAEERLVTKIQVDASTANQPILVPGLLYGVNVANGDPAVNGFFIRAGRPLAATDAGSNAVLLEYNFATHYSLPAQGMVSFAGHQLQYVGQALTPEYFLVTTEAGGFLAEANFAAVFTSLETAQRLSDRPGQVNDLLLTLRAGVDVSAAKKTLEAAFGVDRAMGASVMSREDDPSFRLNDEDIDGDQQMFQIFAVLIFAGAAGAALSLSSRLVEAQRREIGIAMALGLQPWRIAVRPLLVGAQVALLGVVFGVGVGYAIDQAFLPLLKGIQPLPEWRTSFQVGLFAEVAIVGFLLPLLAAAWPVWRAIRVSPIETIRPAYRAGRGGGLAPLLRRLRLPGNTLQQAPLRNLVRSPRRTMLTGLGVAAALAALVSFVGLIDSFRATTDRAERELVSTAPGRLQVRLSTIYPAAGKQIAAISALPEVETAEPGLFLSAALIAGGQTTDLQLELRNLESSIWRPSLISGTYDRQKSGIYVSELAAKDMGLRVGSTVTLRHYKLDPSFNLTTVETPVEVLGVHPHPFRFVAYMDISQSSMFGMQGLANTVDVQPGPGVSQADLKRELVKQPGVSSIESVGDVVTAIRDFLDEFVGVLRVVEMAILLIATLIAFNAATINMDERARENATMMAFGLPVGTIMRLAVVENLILGLAATAMGLLGGWFLIRAIIATRIADTMPDILIKPTVSETTLLVTIVVGVAFVTLAPLLTWRRLTRMDVPATIKVVE